MVEFAAKMEIRSRAVVPVHGVDPTVEHQILVDQVRVKMVELVPTTELLILVLVLLDGLDQIVQKRWIHALPSRAKMAAPAHQAERLLPATVYLDGQALTAPQKSTFA
jgi:hypothetical protein